MENKKGNGIFLGVISVATLIVAMIGATFAYFSATTESDPNAIELGAYEFKLSLSVSPIYPEGASALIPLNPTTTIENAAAPNNTNLLYALNAAKNKCIDDNQLQVCALYQVEITNQATNPMTLSGSIQTVTNNPGAAETAEAFTNLTYQALSGSHEDNTLTLVGDPVTLNQAIDGLVDIADITVPGATYDEDTGDLVPGVGYSYVLIYLNDAGEDQSTEMGATYTGKLIYSSSGGNGTALTGTFKVAAPETEEENTEEPTE